MKVNTVGKLVSNAEFAYLAGLIDGDGAIMASLEKHSEKRYGFRVRVIVKIAQKKKEFIDWIPNTFGVGSVRSCDNSFEWLVRDQKEIALFLQRILPFLRIKRKQALIATIILRESISSKEDLIKVAELADSLASLNVRSRNRRKNFAHLICDINSRND